MFLWRVAVRIQVGTSSNGLKKSSPWGLEKFSLTSMDKDGTKSGFDLEMLNRVAEVVDVPIIASGGAGNIEDIVEVFEKTTATGALAAFYLPLW